jgi:thermitase
VKREKVRLKRASSTIVSILILASMLAVSFTTRTVEATGTVYSRTDGSIDAQTTPIQLADSNDRDFDVDGSAEKYWSLDSAKGWGDLVYADEDSAELVIGLNNAGLDASAEFSRVIAMNGGRIVDTASNEESIWAIVADIPFDLVPSFECEVKSNSLVKYVEPNFRFQTYFVPNDPSWNMQWGSQMINADWAWNTTVGNNSVLVAIIDSGIDYDHPDLAANYVALGYDWVNNDTDPMDDNGHGTHCAGIIAAAINNSVGIAGLAQVRVMAEKAFDSGGFGWSWDIAKAIKHAVDQGAKILSDSWGSSENSKLVHDAVEYAYDNGVLIVAAAGNDPTSRKNYPAAHDEVIAVTAIDQNLDPASFTSFGDWVELAAPGVDIYSTVPWGYESWSGTSMACPHVSGVAALIWSCFPSMTRDQVRAQLRYSSQDLGAVGFDNYYGYGLPQADWAVETPPPEHDLLVLDFERKHCIKLANQAIFNSSVLNFGASDETNVEVRLLVNDSLVDSVNIASLSSGSTTTVGLSWTPTVEGNFNVSCYIVPVAGETWTYYNVVSEVVSVKERIFVPDDYPTIQEAVDAASSGFEILVRGGTYYENVVVDKALLVSGESSATTIIDAGGQSYAVRVESSNVTVANFTMQNATLTASYFIIPPAIALAETA